MEHEVVETGQEEFAQPRVTFARDPKPPSIGLGLVFAFLAVIVPLIVAVITFFVVQRDHEKNVKSAMEVQGWIESSRARLHRWPESIDEIGPAQGDGAQAEADRESWPLRFDLKFLPRDGVKDSTGYYRIKFSDDLGDSELFLAVPAKGK